MLEKFFYSFLLSLIVSGIFMAQVKDRMDIDDNYKWDLSDLYADVDTWRNAKSEIEARLPEISRFQGKLSESADNLYYTMQTTSDILKEFYRLTIYASRLRDQDLNISANESLAQEASALGTKFGEVSSFINPEILKIVPQKIAQFYKDKPELKDFETAINDIQRLRDHTLSEREEQILASFGQVTGTPSDVYSTSSV